MIIEAIILGITAVFVSSLAFASHMVKHFHKWDIEDVKESEAKPEILPFIRIVIGTPCPKCKEPGANAKGDLGSRGPGVAEACKDSKCKVRNTPHLHCRCMTCSSVWLMHTADSTPEAKKEAE